MTPRTYSNIAVSTTLSSAITAGATSLVVADATGYPAAPFAIAVESEVMLVTAKAGTTFDVTRGYDGSTAASHDSGVAVIHAAIADDFRGMQLGTRDVASDAPSDGQVLTWDDAQSRWEPAAGGGGGGAPTDATYLVTTANGSLSAEVVVGATPGGELGGTWASPTVDATHSGSSHAAVQAAAEATAAAALSTHESDTTNVHGIADTSALIESGDAAGGVLSGTYPNPGFAADMATQAELNAHEADTTSVHGITDTSALVTLTGSQTLTNKTLTAPTIADFTNAQHDHLDADDGGTLTAAAIGDASANGRSLITAANYAAMRALLDLEIGTDVQAYSADLAALVSGGLPVLIVGASTYSGYADYTCDGTADDVQIQAAIDALPAAGGTVVLTAGTFTVANAGTVTGDSLSTPYCIAIRQTHGAVRLLGQGAGATKIRLANSQASNSIPLLIRGTSAAKRTSETTIQGIEFDGNSANQGSAWTDFSLVEAVYADNVTLRQCFVHSSPFFLTQTFRNSFNARWIDNRFVSSATNHQVRFEAPGVLVQGNWFEGAAGASDGAMLALATNADIDVNTEAAVVQGNRFVGGFQAINAGGAWRCVIQGNIVESQTHNNSTSIKIEHYTGAVNYSGLYNIVADNILYDIRNGIELGSTTTYGAQYCHIHHNIIIDGPNVALQNGIRETGASANNNLIELNRILGTVGVAAITVVGAATIARNNEGATSTNDFASLGGTQTLTNKTLTAPTIADFTNAGHDHLDADDGGTLSASAIASGTMATARLGSGTADNTTFLRGDQTWATPGGAGTVTSVGLSMPTAIFDVANSPVTGADTLAVTLDNQNANTAFRGPASGSAAAPTFRAAVLADLPDFHKYVVYHDDFIATIPNATSISGTAAAINVTSANILDAGGNPGWIAMVTGTATTGRAVVTSAAGAQVLFGNGAWVFEALVNIPTLSDGTETYVIRAGWNDNASAVGADAIMFSYTHSASSGNWECITRANSVQTLTDSTIAVVAATNYKLRIEVNAAASQVLFYINGTLRATHSANIPSGSGRQTAPQLGIIKSAGTTSREMLCDYIHYECELTVTR